MTAQTKQAGVWNTQASALKDNMAGNSKKKNPKGKIRKRKKIKREKRGF